jgi:hypothetical protein
MKASSDMVWNKNNRTYNWFIVCAALRPPENAVKIIITMMHVVLRPYKSLSFAQVTRPTSRYMLINDILRMACKFRGC